MRGAFAIQLTTLWLGLAGCGFQIAAGPADGGADPDRDATTDAGDADAAVGDAPADAMDPMAAVAALNGQRWLVPCTSGDLGIHNCSCALGVSSSMATIGGVPPQRFEVTVRIRGALEAINYLGGTSTATGWHVGGTPADLSNNYYKLEIDAPAQVYWLNRGTPTSQRSFRYDYQATFTVDAGTTVRFHASGQDGLQWANYDGTGPITFPGVSTSPDPYDGQFAQLEVVSATVQ